MHYPCAARSKPFVAKDYTLTIEQHILDYFDLAKTMHDQGLTADIGMWSPPWFEMMDSNNPEFMGFFLPPWGLHYVIKPNAKNTVGDWGLCKGPGTFFWGGTTGDVVSSKSVCNKIKANYSDPQLAGQNHYEFFTQQALKADVKNTFPDVRVE
jgi:multiple sugar transport system substrate-binding protein